MMEEKEEDKEEKDSENTSGFDRFMILFACILLIFHFIYVAATMWSWWCCYS